MVALHITRSIVDKLHTEQRIRTKLAAQVEEPLNKDALGDMLEDEMVGNGDIKPSLADKVKDKLEQAKAKGSSIKERAKLTKAAMNDKLSASMNQFENTANFAAAGMGMLEAAMDQVKQLNDEVAKRLRALTAMELDFDKFLMNEETKQRMLKVLNRICDLDIPELDINPYKQLSDILKNPLIYTHSELLNALANCGTLNSTLEQFGVEPSEFVTAKLNDMAHNGDAESFNKGLDMYGVKPSETNFLGLGRHLNDHQKDVGTFREINEKAKRDPSAHIKEFDENGRLIIDMSSLSEEEASNEELMKLYVETGDPNDEYVVDPISMKYVRRESLLLKEKERSTFEEMDRALDAEDPYDDTDYTSSGIKQEDYFYAPDGRKITMKDVEQDTTLVSHRTSDDRTVTTYSTASLGFHYEYDPVTGENKKILIPKEGVRIKDPEPIVVTKDVLQANAKTYEPSPPKDDYTLRKVSNYYRKYDSDGIGIPGFFDKDGNELPWSVARKEEINKEKAQQTMDIISSPTYIANGKNTDIPTKPTTVSVINEPQEPTIDTNMIKKDGFVLSRIPGTDKYRRTDIDSNGDAVRAHGGIFDSNGNCYFASSNTSTTTTVTETEDKSSVLTSGKSIYDKRDTDGYMLVQELNNIPSQWRGLYVYRKIDKSGKYLSGYYDKNGQQMTA